MREINYDFNAVELNILQHATDHRQVEVALGYLSTWNMSFPVVRIFLTRDHEITACYYKSPHDDGSDKASYAICAVWREDERKFSFHS